MKASHFTQLFAQNIIQADNRETITDSLFDSWATHGFPTQRARNVDWTDTLNDVTFFSKIMWHRANFWQMETQL